MVTHHSRIFHRFAMTPQVPLQLRADPWGVCFGHIQSNNTLWAPLLRHRVFVSLFCVKSCEHTNFSAGLYSMHTCRAATVATWLHHSQNPLWTVEPPLRINTETNPSLVLFINFPCDVDGWPRKGQGARRVSKQQFSQCFARNRIYPSPPEWPLAV